MVGIGWVGGWVGGVGMTCGVSLQGSDPCDHPGREVCEDNYGGGHSGGGGGEQRTDAVAADAAVDAAVDAAAIGIDGGASGGGNQMTIQ